MDNNVYLKDRKILYLLNENARISNKKLGKLSGCSREVAEYHLKKLHSLGFVKEYLTLIDTSKLGYDNYLLLIELQNYNIEHENQIIAQLKSHPFIKWLIKCNGSWDLQMTITAKDKKQLASIIDEITLICADKLRRYDLTNNVHFLKDENLSFLLPKKDQVKEINKPSKTLLKQKRGVEFVLDQKDHLILQYLSNDAKIKLIDLAKKTKLSVDTVKARIKKLKDNKVILRFQGVVDLTKLDYSIYYLFLRFSNISEEYEHQIKFFFSTIPEVIFVERVLGNWDLRVEIVTSSAKEYEAILVKIREFFSTQLKYYNFSLMLKEHQRNAFPKGLWL